VVTGGGMQWGQPRERVGGTKQPQAAKG